MNYDLTKVDDRKRFVRRCNSLLKKQRTNVSVVDESGRTTNQNSYLHVLCRILAAETGVTERYAKEVYLKNLACPDIFKTVTKDMLSGTMVTTTRSTADLTLPEMRRAIQEFRNWAAENGYALPDATIEDDGSVTFASSEDKDAFHQAEVNTSKLEDYL